jgi:deazaflavin-dependent oxidoreductase (nitroreductase family)
MEVDRILHRFNPVIVGILRSPLHFLLSGAIMLVTVTGRRTGRRYTIPVGYRHAGERIDVLVSRARRKNWWRNFETPSPVEIRVRGRALQGHARVVPQSAPEFREAVARTLARMPALGSRLGIDYDPKARINEEQWSVLAERNALVSIALDDA